MLTVATSSDRDKRRERERRARMRRAVNLQQMRDTRHTLESALLVLHTVDDVDAVWEDFLDDHVLRVRHFVRQSLRLAKEARELQLERAQLVHLFEEHRLSSQAFATALNEYPVNDWDLKLAKWRALSRSHYKPWKLEDCQVEMAAALKEVNAFDWSLEKETSGLSFLGWREQRRVDNVRNAFQFQFHKTYRGYEMMDAVNVGWDMYTEPKTFQEAIVGNGVLSYHEVLQQLGPNIVIVWAVARRQAVGADVHMTFMVCRVQTERGIRQCVRSIVCPELIQVVAGAMDMWASTFVWKEWSQLEGEENGYTYRLGGSIVGKDATYLNQWMLSIFSCVLRSERLSTSRQLITSSD